MADSTIAAETEQTPPSIFSASEGSDAGRHRVDPVVAGLHHRDRRGCIFRRSRDSRGACWGRIAGCWRMSPSASCSRSARQSEPSSAGDPGFSPGCLPRRSGSAVCPVRCGPLHYVLFDAITNKRSQSIFLRLAMEHCIVMIPIALLWLYFWQRFSELRPGIDHRSGRRETAEAQRRQR